MKKLLLCGIIFMGLIGCDQGELQRLRTENQELKTRVGTLEQEITKLKETSAQSPGSTITGDHASQESGSQKLESCQREAEKIFVGKTRMINDYRGRFIEVVKESITLKCEYNDLYTSGRIFNKSDGTREDLAWSQNSDAVICPETTKKYGSICK